MMVPGSQDPHSIENEPHRRASKETPSGPIETPLTPEPAQSPMHTVWDEPGRSNQLTGPVPEDALTYTRWLASQRDQTTVSRSWLTTGIIILLAGPLSILGTFLSPLISGLIGFWGLLSLVLIGPLTEELMKTVLALWVVEKRPFWFRSPVQILLCAVVGGLVFACIENFIYLHVYIEDPSAEIVRWRWTICVFLHTGCSLIAGLGLCRIWNDVWSRMATPRMGLAIPYLATAVAIHGTYNGLCIVLERTLFQF